METRANYVLIGAFALLGFLGMLGFFLWFARTELDRQFDVYDIDFTSVSGLSDASDVRFAGLSVGRVESVGLSREQPGLVRVRIEVDGSTPVRVDSVATIEAQGVTGVSYVGISAGSPNAPLLADASDRDVPLIPAGQSALQAITEDAPQLLSETLELMRELRDMVGAENQQRIEKILTNVEDASSAFSLALDDFSSISGTVADFTEEIGAFNEALSSLTGDASGMIETAESTLRSIEAAAEDGRVLIGQGGQTLDGIDGAVASAREDLADTTERLRTLAQSADDTLTRFQASLDEADTTLSSARNSFTEADRTMARLRDSFDEADMTMETVRETLEPGRAALEAAENAFTGAEQAFANDLPEMTAILRSTLTELDSAVARIAEDLPEVTSGIRQAARSAETAFAGIERAVGASAPAFRDFAQTALPQYGRLAVETRALVENLDRLFEQLRRDPGRFFIEPRAPEYRR